MKVSVTIKTELNGYAVTKTASATLEDNFPEDFTGTCPTEYEIARDTAIELFKAASKEDS